jgi:hypothetical protein
MHASHNTHKHTKHAKHTHTHTHTHAHTHTHTHTVMMAVKRTLETGCKSAQKTSDFKRSSFKRTDTHDTRMRSTAGEPLLAEEPRVSGGCEEEARP